MDASLKQRLWGAVVLVALAVIFLPMLVKGPAPDSGVSDVPLDVPAEPKGGTGMVTRDLPLVAPGDTPDGGAVGMPATVPDAAQPARDDAAADTPFPAVAAGDYAVSFGSYGSAADADKVIAALARAQLPGYRESIDLNGRKAERVRIGPFADRALAESARLRAGAVRDDVQAKVVVLDVDAAQPASAARPEPAKPEPVAAKQEPRPQPKPEPKPATPAPKPPATAAAKPATEAPAAKPEPPVAKPASAAGTGFAVQVGAFSSGKDALALRDRLRGLGFNAFTESVPTDKGTLTRVRVGPAMTRAEAEQLKASVQARTGISGMVRSHP